MPGGRRGQPRGTREAPPDPREAPRRYERGRTCAACGAPLSAYNAGPTCWRHATAVPWRGPTAKPRLE